MNCIFCDIVNKKSPSWTVYQDEFITAFFDYYPATRGHILIVPNKHYANIFEVTDDILGRVVSLGKKISIFYKNNLGIDNINFIQSNGEIAGQEVFHYHMHIVPRYINDNVKFHWISNENIRNEYDDLKNYISNGITK